MEILSPSEMLERLAALPAGQLVLERLRDEPNVYVVGGAVRDLLLGRTPTELDLAIDGDALGVAKRLGGQLVFHDRFGTSTTLLDGHRYDIARTRTERYPHPGALPEVSPASLPEDLGRRDFTINAIALALGGEHAGTLTAAAGAFDDLERGLLRVLHDASFRDDPTRMLRLARYAARLGFAVEPRTRELMGGAIVNGALETVSGARIGSELRLLVGEPDSLAALGLLAELGLADALEPRFGIADPTRAHRALELLPGDGRRDLLTMMLASERLAPNYARRLLDRLAFEAPDRDRIVAAVARAPEIEKALAAAGRPSQIAAAVEGAGPELVALAGATEAARANAREWLAQLRHVHLEIDGDDLLAAGLPQGPAIGAGLRAALAAKLDGSLEDREAELEAALEAVRRHH